MTVQWIDNVRIERALVTNADGETTTLSERGAIAMEDGVFTQVLLGERVEGLDGGGRLVLPSFRDTHIHLDKTFYGGPWRAPIPGRFWLAEEERLLPEMSEQIPVRSNAVLDLLVANGTTRVVAHCNVDHIVGTQNVTRLLDVLRARDDVDWDVVAYPQHGLRKGEILPLLAEALESGATMVGGLDPGLIEHDVEGALASIFELAVRYGVDVDLHLHDAGTLGRYEIGTVADLVAEHGWQGRVALSCASALAGCDAGLIDRLAEARIRVGTTMSVGGPVIPIPALDAAGVEVSLGSDSIMDILTPFGRGDILEQLWILAQRFGWSGEESIARTLYFGAGDPGQWGADGTRAWPAVGDEASFLLVPAGGSAEAIARRVPRQAVFHRGRKVAG